MKYVLRLTMLIGGCLALQACCFGSSQPASGPGAPTPPGAPAFGLPVPSSAPVPPGAPAVGQVPAGATPPGGFTAMQLPSVPMPYAPNSFVWAGFSNTPDWSQWSFGRVRFIGAEGNHAKVQAMFRERLTPSAFVSPAIAPAALAPGAPVLYATAMPIYGRVISVAGAQAQIANGQAASYRTAPRDLETVLAPNVEARDPSELAVQAALARRNVPFWEVGSHASATLRVTTRFEREVEWNFYTEEERVRTTYTFEVSSVDRAVRVENASDSVTQTLQVNAPDALFEEVRAALRKHLERLLPKPRIAAHPSAPDDWLARAAAFGLGSPGMELARTGNTVALWHAHEGGWFGTLYAASPPVLYALGPRPPLASPTLAHTSAPTHAPRLEQLRARISDTLGVLGSETLEASGVSTRVRGGWANPSCSIAYFDSEEFDGEFSWTRTRTRDGWLLTSERADPAKPHPTVEMVWTDARGRYFVCVKYQYFNGHRLEAMFVGEHAEALRSMLAQPDRAA